jgi:hypothetical protein
MYANAAPSEPLNTAAPTQARTNVTHGAHEFLTGGQVAYALRICPETLAEWRRKGRPLNWTNIDGRPKYRRSEVLRWLYRCSKNIGDLEPLASVPHGFLSEGQVGYSLRIGYGTLADWRRRGKPLTSTGIAGQYRYRLVEVVQWIFQSRNEILSLEATTFGPEGDDHD